MIELSRNDPGATTDGTFRKAVFQPAGFCIPLLRPYRHPWLPERSVSARTEQVVYFFRDVLDMPVADKEVLRQCTNDYQNWVEAYARNHNIPIQWPKRESAKSITSYPRCAGWRRPTLTGSTSSSRALHLQEHGTGPHFPCYRAEVSYPGPELPCSAKWFNITSCVGPS
jgi:hypothetical protein